MKELLNTFKNQRFKKFVPVYIAVLAIIVLLGTSYALLRTSQVGEHSYVLNVGGLEIQFLDNNTDNMSLSGMLPMTDSDGLSQSNNDDLVFTIKNTGTLRAEYDVYIEEISTDPAMKTVIRYANKRGNGNYSDPKTLSVDKYIERDGTIAVNEEITYRVKAWLDQNADSTYANKTFSAKIVVEAKQFQNAGQVILKTAEDLNNSGTNVTYVDDNTVYLTGDKNTIDFNYIWYSGKLWRAVSVSTTGTMKMITEQNMATLNYNPTGQAVYYTDASTNSYLYQWLNQDFYNTLQHKELLNTTATWNATTIGGTFSTKLLETNMVTAPVGTLNSYEYYVVGKDVVDKVDSYINNSYYFFLSNPYSSSRIMYVCALDCTNPYSNVVLSRAFGVRPMVELAASTEFVSGSGTKSDPYRLVEEGDLTGAYLNTRTNGEYVNFDGALYQIVDIEGTSTKLISYHAISGIKQLASSATYAAAGNTQSNSFWDYYLNNTWYDAVSSTYKAMMVQGTYYRGTQSGTAINYKAYVCQNPSATATVKDCIANGTVADNVNLYVGLSRVGELMSNINDERSVAVNVYSMSNNLTSATDNPSYYINVSGGGYGSTYSTNRRARPTISLSPNVIITSGDGTIDSPFEIAMAPSS